MLTDSRTASRLLAAFGLVAGPLLWLASTAISPAWSDDGGEFLAEVAASPTRHLLSGALFLIGSIVILPGLIGTAHLLRGRRVTAGQVGAYLIAIGALVAGGFSLVLSAIEVAMVDDAANRAEMIALSDRGEESAVALAGFLGTFLVGIVGGFVLLAIGLWTRRAVPVWSPLLLLAAIPALFFLGESAAGSAVGMAIVVAALAPVAWTVLSVTDEQWERWQVLPERSRRRTATADELGSASPV